MTQYVIIEAATRRVLGGNGARDPADMVGPLAPAPEAEPGTSLKAWQGRLDFSAGIGVMVWEEGANEPTWRDDRTLADARANKNATINASRLLANRTSFSFGGKEIACDELSALDIASMNGIVALTGVMPPNWPGAWKAMDNTYVAIPDRATWISFYGSMVQAGTDNFTRAQTLKAALSAATTNAEVDAITW